MNLEIYILLYYKSAYAFNSSFSLHNGITKQESFIIKFDVDMPGK